MFPNSEIVSVAIVMVEIQNVPQKAHCVEAWLPGFRVVFGAQGHELHQWTNSLMES